MKNSNLSKLEQMMIDELSKNSTNKVMTNKTLLIEFMLKNNEDRKIIPIKVASMYFEKTNNLDVNKSDFIKKVTSIKNSLDTMISNFNSEDKIKNDDQLNGLKLERKLNKYTLKQ